jgi:hypothetical protein
MPRRIEISVPSEQAGTLSAELMAMKGLIGIQRQPGASLQPSGDVVVMDVTNDELANFMRYFAENGFGIRSDRSLSTSEPVSVLSASSRNDVLDDSSEASWEEMERQVYWQRSASRPMLCISSSLRC